MASRKTEIRPTTVDLHARPPHLLGNPLGCTEGAWGALTTPILSPNIPLEVHYWNVAHPLCPGEDPVYIVKRLQLSLCPSPLDTGQPLSVWRA